MLACCRLTPFLSGTAMRSDLRLIPLSQKFFNLFVCVAVVVGDVLVVVVVISKQASNL